jgi:hypothetical protein
MSCDPPNFRLFVELPFASSSIFQRGQLYLFSLQRLNKYSLTGTVPNV